MSELIAIYLLGLAYGTLFGMLIAFVVWIIYKAKVESER